MICELIFNHKDFKQKPMDSAENSVSESCITQSIQWHASAEKLKIS